MVDAATYQLLTAKDVLDFEALSKENVENVPLLEENDVIPDNSDAGVNLVQMYFWLNQSFHLEGKSLQTC